jgi:hypothetical protein
MVTSHKSVAVLLSAVLATSSFLAPVHAKTSADCAPEINRLQSETREFGRDVEEQVRAFTQAEVADASLNAMGTLLKNNPTAAALSDLRNQKKKWDDWGELTKATATTLEDLSKCISTPGCSLIEFARRQNEAFRLWIQSLASDGLSAASERVSKAASLYRGYVNRALSMAHNSMLNSCAADFEQSATNSPVDARDPSNLQARPTTTVKSGGGGGATAVRVGAAVGVIGVGGVVLKKQLDKIMADSAGTTTSSSGSSSSSNSNWVYANWTCNNSSQCIAVRGHAMGSAGPFCSVSACTAWYTSYGLGTCTSQPQYPTMIWNYPPAGTCSK